MQKYETELKKKNNVALVNVWIATAYDVPFDVFYDKKQKTSEFPARTSPAVCDRQLEFTVQKPQVTSDVP